MGSYLYCPKCNEYLGSLGGDSCSCGWEQAPFEEPQQRTWVGLTKEDIEKLWANSGNVIGYGGLTFENIRAIEAKLKEKNT